MNKPAMKAIRKQAQGGFTLIELIVVIVILGILAATALPKFASLGGDARVASLNAVKGAISAEVSMVHGQYLINPTLTTVTNEGQAIAITNGYPAGDAPSAAGAGITANDYVIVASVAGATAGSATSTPKYTPAIPVNGYVVVPNSVAATAAALTCFVSYAASTAVNTPPVVGGDLTNCK